MHEHLGRPLAATLDIAGVGVLGFTWFGYLPETAATIASILACLWYGTQLFKAWTGRS